MLESGHSRWNLRKAIQDIEKDTVSHMHGKLEKLQVTNREVQELMKDYDRCLMLVARIQTM